MKFAVDQIIKINSKFLEDYDLLSDKKDRNKGPFKNRKDVFMAAVAYGYLKNNSLPVKNGHDLFRTATFSIEDTVVLKSIFLKKTQMKFDDNYTEQNIIKQAMEWAEAGFEDLKNITIRDPNESNINGLIDEILGK